MENLSCLSQEVASMSIRTVTAIHGGRPQSVTIQLVHSQFFVQQNGQTVISQYIIASTHFRRKTREYVFVTIFDSMRSQIVMVAGGGQRCVDIREYTPAILAFRIEFPIWNLFMLTLGRGSVLSRPYQSYSCCCCYFLPKK